MPSSLDFFFYFDEPEPVSQADEAGQLAAYGQVGDNLSTQRALSKIDRRHEGAHQDPLVAYKPYLDLAPAQSVVSRNFPVDRDVSS